MIHWSIGRKIDAGFALALAVLAVFGAVAYRAGTLMIEAGRLEAHTLEVLNELEETSFLMVAAEGGQRGYLLTGEDHYLQPLRQGQEAVAKDIADLRALTVDNHRHQKHLDELEPLISERFRSLRERLKSRGSPQLPVLLSKGRANMEKLQRVIREMIVEETANLGARREQASQGADRMRAAILWGMGVAFTILGAAAILIVRGITHPIRQTVELLQSASARLTMTAEEHQRTIVRQSTSVSQTASTAAELSASQGQVVGSASSVAALGDKAASAVDAGRATIADTLGGLDDMREKTESASQHISALSEKSKHVGRIIFAIMDITEQINLLALNAAIEAARAGDQGKGFAIVAGEVRKLAEKARKSTDEITGLIEDIQNSTGATVLATEATLKSVQDGRRRADKAARTFEELARLVSETSLAVKQIRLACQQQDSATDQISKAMEQISEGMRETSDSVQQTVSSATQLTSMADRLRALIG